MKLTEVLTKEQIDVWVTALESGSYEQCNMTLHKTVDGDDKFCCIGVLAHTMGMSISELDNMGAYDILSDPSYNDQLNEIFWDLNDKYTLTFPEIANRIKGMVVAES